MSTATDPTLPTSRNLFQLTSPPDCLPPWGSKLHKSRAHACSIQQCTQRLPRSLALNTCWLNALKGTTMYLGGCLLGHCLKWWKLEIAEIRGWRPIIRRPPCPSVPVSPSVAFSSRFKWSLPFSESLSHSPRRCVWHNLQTFHKVRVWGEINMLSKPFHQIEAFRDLFHLKGQNDPFLKRLVRWAHGNC